MRQSGEGGQSSQSQTLLHLLTVFGLELLCIATEVIGIAQVEGDLFGRN